MPNESHGFSRICYFSEVLFKRSHFVHMSESASKKREIEDEDRLLFKDPL